MSGVDPRHGIGVSPGTAIGPVVQVRPPVRPPADEPGSADPGESSRLIREVLESVAGTLEERAARADATARQILTATAMMARDPGLATAADKHLAGGRGPAAAVDAATGEYCAMFSAAGGYLAERVTDLRDVCDRAVARLLGLEDPGVPELTEPSVIVAHDLAPAETANLRRDLVLAIVTESGGPTSHTAILAAQMGIPAVVQLPGAAAIGVGTVLAVDGVTGEVFVDPDPATCDELVQRSERRAKALGTAVGPGMTSDGHPVALLANIGTAEDAERAGVLDVEGVGLFRTEFLFLDKETAPSLEEQVTVYTRVFEAFGSRRVVVRTLDAGADKPLAFANRGDRSAADKLLGRHLRVQHDLLAVQVHHDWAPDARLVADRHRLEYLHLDIRQVGRDGHHPAAGSGLLRRRSDLLRLDSGLLRRRHQLRVGTCFGGRGDVGAARGQAQPRDHDKRQDPAMDSALRVVSTGLAQLVSLLGSEVRLAGGATIETGRLIRVMVISKARVMPRASSLLPTFTVRPCSSTHRSTGSVLIPAWAMLFLISSVTALV